MQQILCNMRNNSLLVIRKECHFNVIRKEVHAFEMERYSLEKKRMHSKKSVCIPKKAYAFEKSPYNIKTAHSFAKA